jgi:hypothetical protein
MIFVKTEPGLGGSPGADSCRRGRHPRRALHPPNLDRISALGHGAKGRRLDDFRQDRAWPRRIARSRLLSARTSPTASLASPKPGSDIGFGPRGPQREEAG